MARFVVKPAGAGAAPKNSEPLEDTGLFIVDAPDPRARVESSDEIAWAAPTLDDDGAESYPTGEVSVRFETPLDAADLESFARELDVEVRRRNEFVPEQVVVAPTEPRKTWLPDLVESLNNEGLVQKAWPNTLSRYRRV